MTLRTAAHHSFLLLDADELARRLGQWLVEVDFTHVLVRRQDEHGALYYLLSRRTLRHLRLDTDEPLAQALQLGQLQAVEQVSWNLPIEQALETCVVLDDDGEVYGFLAPELRSLGPTRSARSGGRVSGSLHAKFPQQLVLGDTASLLVYLTPEVVYAFDAMPIYLPPGAEVDVVIEVEPGLERGKRREATLIFDADKDSPAEQFKIRAVKTGNTKVLIYAFHEGQALGKLTLRVEVTAEPKQMRAASHSTHNATLSSVDLDGLRNAAPDIDLIIRRTWRHGRQGWVVRAHSQPIGFHFEASEPLWLTQDPQEFLRPLLRDLQDLKQPSRQHLRNLGFELTDQLLPAEIQALLWQHRNHIRTLHIHSDESWVPWELCTLQSKNAQGRVEVFGMLCERFEVTRWHSKAQAYKLARWRKALLIVPGDSKLPEASRLTPASFGLADPPEWQHVVARRNAVTSALSRGDFHLIHYAGHATASSTNPLRNALHLEASEEFTPVDLNGSAGDLGLGHPLVFLNGCKSGQAGLALTRDVGFAERFLEVGAAAFIGTRWEVPDSQAAILARVFYRAIAGGRTVARALRIARWVVARKGGTAWLAYMLLAQPDAPPPLPKATQLVYR